MKHLIIGFHTAVAHLVSHRYQVCKRLLQGQANHSTALLTTALFKSQSVDYLEHGIGDEGLCIGQRAVKIQDNCFDFH